MTGGIGAEVRSNGPPVPSSVPSYVQPSGSGSNSTVAPSFLASGSSNESLPLLAPGSSSQRQQQQQQQPHARPTFGAQRGTFSAGQQPWRWCGASYGSNGLYAMYFFVVLCFVTSVERVSFKMLVDRVVPFRYLVVVLVVLFEAIMLGVIVQFQANCGDGGGQSSQAYTTPFPRRKLLVMAMLDLCKDLMMTLPAAAVAPTLTVMLLQGQLPCTMLLSHLWERYARRMRRARGQSQHDSPNSVASMSSSNPSPSATPPPPTSYSWDITEPADFMMGGGSNRRDELGFRSSHYVGAGLVALSLLVAFIPAAAEWLGGSSDVGWSTLVYLLSCVPASASVLYKERALMAYRQPIDPYVLNLNVDIYQLLMLIPLAPIMYNLQSVGFLGAYDDDSGNSAGGSGNVPFSTSLSAGLTCFFFSDTIPMDDDLDDAAKGQISPSMQRAYCGIALPLLSMYVASILVVNMAVDRVLKYGSGPLLYRAVTAATITAYVVLGFCAGGVPAVTGNGVLSGMSMAMLNLPSAVLLVVGNEVYHRFSEPNAEILTEWVSPS